MNLKPLLLATILFFAATGGAAASEVEDWRLTATISRYSPSTFVPPAFATPGSTLTIDYLIDVSVPSYMGSYFKPVYAVTFNGETSPIPGGYGTYVSAASGSLNALNVSVPVRSSDAVDFISFNDFNPSAVGPTLFAALAGMSSDVATQSGQTEVRLDFGHDSVWGSLISFDLVPAPVPLPNSAGLMLLGLLLLSAAVGHKTLRAGGWKSWLPSKRRLTRVAAASSMLAATGAFASTVTVLDSGQGWISVDGGANGASVCDNYLVGNCGTSTTCSFDPTSEYRNFFEFNIPLSTIAYTSATLTLYVAGLEFDQPGAPTLTYQLTSTSSLSFAALGTGTVYASRTYTNADRWQTESITLNSAALAAIGKGGGQFVLSGRALAPVQFGLNAPEEVVFGGSQGYEAQLILSNVPAPVPLPTSLVSFACGLGLLGVVLRRRTRSGLLPSAV